MGVEKKILVLYLIFIYLIGILSIIIAVSTENALLTLLSLTLIPLVAGFIGLTNN
jgi:hypothetical protein